MLAEGGVAMMMIVDSLHSNSVDGSGRGSDGCDDDNRILRSCEHSPMVDPNGEHSTRLHHPASLLAPCWRWPAVVGVVVWNELDRSCSSTICRSTSFQEAEEDEEGKGGVTRSLGVDLVQSEHVPRLGASNKNKGKDGPNSGASNH